MRTTDQATLVPEGPPAMGATTPATTEKQVQKLKALTIWLPLCGSLLPAGGEPIAEQYAQISARPFDFALIEMVGRVLNLLLNLAVWTWGWRIAGASWLRVACASARMQICCLIGSHACWLKRSPFGRVGS